MPRSPVRPARDQRPGIPTASVRSPAAPCTLHRPPMPWPRSGRRRPVSVAVLTDPDRRVSAARRATVAVGRSRGTSSPTAHARPARRPPRPRSPALSPEPYRLLSVDGDGALAMKVWKSSHGDWRRRGARQLLHPARHRHPVRRLADTIRPARAIIRIKLEVGQRQHVVAATVRIVGATAAAIASNHEPVHSGVHYWFLRDHRHQRADMQPYQPVDAMVHRRVALAHGRGSSPGSPSR